MLPCAGILCLIDSLLVLSLILGFMTQGRPWEFESHTAAKAYLMALSGRLSIRTGRIDSESQLRAR
jgi:hypothetical protein